jgi:nucleotide-binding universal stress UspA family protein
MLYERILVPVDDSRTSNRGLQEAVRIAKACGSCLRLVHVIDEFLAVQDSAYAFGTDDFIETLRVGGKKALERAAALVAKAGVPAETRLVESMRARVAEVIVKDAGKWRADLIVMGTHGRRGVSHLILGSDAELVIRSSTVPVLLVRDVKGRKPRA